jgi:DDE family transposase
MYVIEEPRVEPRLRKRYKKLVKKHVAISQSVATGAHKAARLKDSFAAAVGASRFYNNPRVSLPQLAEPVIKSAHLAVNAECRRYALVAHDWSDLNYSTHESKTDRTMLSKETEFGYELQTALVVSDVDGAPLAPVYLGLRAADGVHSTRRERVLPTRAGLDELGRTINYIKGLALSKELAHIVDREGDSVLHMRRWQRQGHLFVLRGNEIRRVEHERESRLLEEVIESLRAQFEFSREIEYRGKKAGQYVAETKVNLTRPAKLNRRKGGQRIRRYVPGRPLELRLIVSEVRDKQGQVLARWLLWSNLPQEVSASTIAQWYYWRWRIESFFRLLKRGGFHLEQWQQETVEAVARRLLVATQASVLVWALMQSNDPRSAQLTISDIWRSWLTPCSTWRLTDSMNHTRQICV